MYRNLQACFKIQVAIYMVYIVNDTNSPLHSLGGLQVVGSLYPPLPP